MAAADTIRDFPHVEGKRCGDCGARFGREAAFCPFCGVPLASSTWDRALDPNVGKTVDGRYEVLEPLGEGGMGTVYKVRHVTLNRLFAMKALRRDLALDAALSQRFIHEARATAAIKHPSVVSINDFGVLEDGIPYFVMELLVGETLATHLRARGALPPRDAISIARRIADGLSASHAANVIHRDLKPENVFLVSASELRIVDFGAAKIVGGSKLTKPGVVFGTPYYMSPEQAAGQPIDGRADVYSLGVLLFEMLTGRVPFEADTYMGVLTKHMFAQPPRPSEAVASRVRLGALEDVVLRALEKDPSHRYASMIELKKALDDAEKSHVAVPPARTQPIAQLGTLRMSTAERIERSVEQQLARERQHRRKQVMTAAVAMVMTLLALGTIATFVFKGNAPTAGAEPLASSSAAPIPSAAPVPLPSPAPVESATVAATVDLAPPVPISAPAPSATIAVARSAATPRSVPPPKTTSITKPVEPPPAAPTPPKKSEDFSDPWQK